MINNNGNNNNRQLTLTCFPFIDLDYVTHSLGNRNIIYYSLAINHTFSRIFVAYSYRVIDIHLEIKTWKFRRENDAQSIHVTIIKTLFHSCFH